MVKELNSTISADAAKPNPPTHLLMSDGTSHQNCVAGQYLSPTNQFISIFVELSCYILLTLGLSFLASSCPRTTLRHPLPSPEHHMARVGIMVISLGG